MLSARAPRRAPPAPPPRATVGRKRGGSAARRPPGPARPRPRVRHCGMTAVTACPRGFPAEAAGLAAGPQLRCLRTRPTRRRWGGRRPRRQRHLCVVGGVRQQPLPAAPATACRRRRQCWAARRVPGGEAGERQALRFRTAEESFARSRTGAVKSEAKERPMATTSRERIRRILAGEKIDRLGKTEAPWPHTRERWLQEGLPQGVLQDVAQGP